MFARFLGGVIAAAAVFQIGAASAQTFPVKPVTIVVAQPPGNQQDLLARIMANGMSKLLGQPVIVENKAGAATVIGTEYVAKDAPADGYNILVTNAANSAILPLTVKGLRFDPLKDVTPLIALGDGRLVLATGANNSWKDFKGMMDAAKAQPGKLNYGASSATVRLLMETILRGVGGAQVVHVPFSGTGPNVNAVVAGETQMTIYPDSQALALADKNIVVAITGEQRSKEYPNVPTFDELGLKNIWGVSYSFSVRTGTPKPIMDRLYQAAFQTMNAPDVKPQIDKLQLTAPSNVTGEKVQEIMTEMGKVFAAIAKDINLQPE